MSTNKLEHASTALWVAINGATISRSTETDPNRAFVVKVPVSRRGLGPTDILTYGATEAEAVNNAFDKHDIMNKERNEREVFIAPED